MEVDSTSKKEDEAKDQPPPPDPVGEMRTELKAALSEKGIKEAQRKARLKAKKLARQKSKADNTGVLEGDKAGTGEEDFEQLNRNGGCTGFFPGSFSKQSEITHPLRELVLIFAANGSYFHNAEAEERRVAFWNLKRHSQRFTRPQCFDQGQALTNDGLRLH